MLGNEDIERRPMLGGTATNASQQNDNGVLNRGSKSARPPRRGRSHPRAHNHRLQDRENGNWREDVPSNFDAEPIRGRPRLNRGYRGHGPRSSASRDSQDAGSAVNYPQDVTEPRRPPRPRNTAPRGRGRGRDPHCFTRQDNGAQIEEELDGNHVRPRPRTRVRGPRFSRPVDVDSVTNLTGTLDLNGADVNSQIPETGVREKDQALETGASEARHPNSNGSVRHNGYGQGGGRNRRGGGVRGQPRGNRGVRTSSGNNPRGRRPYRNAEGPPCAEGTLQEEDAVLQEEGKPEAKQREILSFREKEIKQFQVRFPRAEKVEGQGDKFAFLFTPSDPDWPFDVRHINFLICFPEDYPETALSMKTVNKDDVMPALLVCDIDSAVAEWIAPVSASRNAQQTTFRKLIKCLDTNLQGVFVESLRKLKKSQEGPRVVLVEPKRRVSPDQEKVREESTDEDPMDDLASFRVLPKKEEKLKELEEFIAQGPAAKPVFEVPRPSPGNSQLTKVLMNYDPQTAPRKGIEIKFRFVDLSESMSFIVCDRLVISVQCKKCKKLADFRLLPGKLSVVHCSKCPAAITACFRPSILFQFNTILGYLELKECLLRDVALSRCHFYFDCQSCSHLTPLEGVHLGHRSSSNCGNCNIKTQLTLDSFKYLDLCALDTTIKASKAGKANKDIAIQAGKPLPQNGACKHYKKSFRWFRFPCCGQAHPCDDCHNEAEDHLAEYASRMICGFCAKEQPFSNDKPCSKCSNNTIARRTSHWEGGKGCRNKLKMDTNDPKKYAGLNKTIPRKSTAKAK